ncbi:MAG: prepilin-type N-terminal cleavage/methylation domain-containing protein [Candidatus Paceibacteria bacterium]|jgi:prepilin-type N-terminal cleavage/methylation domain-containing protein
MNKKGFTLIEVMISTGLFSVIMTLGVTAVLNTSTLHKKSQDQRSVLDSMAFIVEDMARLMRTGSSFNCDLDVIGFPTEDPASCPIGFNGFPVNFIAFEAPGGTLNDPSDQNAYAILEDGIYWDEDFGQSIFSQNPKFRLTPENISFNTNESGFVVRGAKVGDNEQPIVFIRLDGQIENEKEDFSTPFSYQFAITPRRIDS